MAMTEDELIECLEISARKGRVGAIKLLMEYYGFGKFGDAGEDEEPEAGSVADELARRRAAAR